MLLQKFLDYKLSPHITIWSLVFLQDREHFVSIGNKTSTIFKSNAGTPQETIAGPNDFKLLINDLLVDINNAKYVDDITMSSISTDPDACSLQSVTDHACSWSVKNDMCISEKKTKEMLIHFGTKLT